MEVPRHGPRSNRPRQAYEVPHQEWAVLDGFRPGIKITSTNTLLPLVVPDAAFAAVVVHDDQRRPKAGATFLADYLLRRCGGADAKLPGDPRSVVDISDFMAKLPPVAVARPA